MNLTFPIFLAYKESVHVHDVKSVTFSHYGHQVEKTVISLACGFVQLFQDFVQMDIAVG